MSYDPRISDPFSAAARMAEGHTMRHAELRRALDAGDIELARRIVRADSPGARYLSDAVEVQRLGLLDQVEIFLRRGDVTAAAAAAAKLTF